jgi:uncharacterized iron-regulated membrane protein
MRKMQDFGAIRIRLEAEGTVDVFVILARTVQLARELDAADRAAPEPPDFVEQIHKRLRANPVWGWIIVVVLALAVFCGLIADIVTVLNSIGCAPTAP